MKKQRIITEPFGSYNTVGLTKKNKLKVKKIKPRKDDIKMSIVGDKTVLIGRTISVAETEDTLYPKPIQLCRRISRKIKNNRAR